MTQAPLPDSGSGVRRRLLLSLAATVAIAAVAVLLLVIPGGPGGSDVMAPPPEECLRSWNADEETLSLGRHNRTFHRYRRAQVGYLPADGSSTVVSADPVGSCTVVFAREDLDPEIVAAGNIERAGRWAPLSELLDGEALARMQEGAIRQGNAELTAEGRLVPLP